MSKLPVAGYCMVTLQLPDSSIQELNISDLPEDWQLSPPPDSLKTVGDNFIAGNRHLALKLPSAVMPEDFNCLLNPNHREFNRVKIVAKREISIDNRLMKS
jgi:RES domain-containing protein